jgi:hypothetical protein
MSWGKRLSIAYAIIILLLLHLSLFFCGESDCSFEFDQTRLPRELADRIHIFLSKLPIKLTKIQNYAQWIVIGEIALIIIEFVRLLRRIFCWIIWIILTVSCLIGILAYLSIIDSTNEIWSKLIESGATKSLQISNSII